MNLSSHQSRILATLVFMLLGLAMVQTAHPQNQRVYDYRLGLPEVGSGPQRPVGSLAPDFTLPRLQSYIDREGRPPLAMATLSSYRNKKLVVLIMSAYT